MRYILVISALLLTLPVSAAQENSLVGRLFFLWEGNIYSWLPGETIPTPHTMEGFFADLAISPDGNQLAYTHVSENLGAQQRFNPDVKDIWLWNLAANTRIPVALQAADADLPIEWIRRSGAVWSPDGSHLAYTERAHDQQVIRLYDVRAGETRVFSEVVSVGFADAGNFQDQSLQWGALISKYAWTYFSSGGGGTEIWVYADADRPCAYALDESYAPMPRDEPNPVAVSIEWAQYLDDWYIGVHYQSGVYRLTDYQNGDQWEIDALPFLSTIDAPHPVARVRRSIERVLNPPAEVRWGATAPVEIPAARITINQAGEQIAFTQWGETAWTLTIMPGSEVSATLELPLPAPSDTVVSGEIEWAYTVPRFDTPLELRSVERYLDLTTCYS